MKRLRIPTIKEYPETVFQALERLADFQKDTVTVSDLHRTILGEDIFPGDGSGDRWVKKELREGMYYKYGEKNGGPITLFCRESGRGGKYHIKKPLAAMIVADVIRRAMEARKTS